MSSDRPHYDAIRLAADDNVATLLRPVSAGERLRIRGGAGETEIVAAQDTPLCHKIALVALAAGDLVVKYGQPIGEATAQIALGEHVHIHNMRSLRATGKAEGPDVQGPVEENMSKTYTKRLGFLRKKADMSYDEFVDHWLRRHAALCVKLPGLRRYSVNFVDGRSPNFAYDGFSELWFDSEADLTAAFASPEGKTLLADLPNFTSAIDPIISTETQILWP